MLFIFSSLLHRSSSLWVYVFDDSDDQTPHTYLAKTPIPLQALATGREIRGKGGRRDKSGSTQHFYIIMPHFLWHLPSHHSVSGPPGDYVLRDPAGGPRGVVTVMMKWKYPFQPSVDTLLDRQDETMESTEREERRREKAKASQKPIAKPRVKVILILGWKCFKNI